jgi:hypothetical protein
MQKIITVLSFLLAVTFTGYTFDYSNGTFSINSGSVSEIVKGEPRTAFVKENRTLVSDYYGSQETRTLEKDLSGYPQCNLGDPLLDFLYRMAVEEMLLNVNSKGHFVAGEKWNQAWTRDLSYSVLLSLAFLKPGISFRSLEERLYDGIILQDTGTGGSWPVSSDRVTWFIAANEVTKQPEMAGKIREWYPAAVTTMNRHLAVNYNRDYSLFYGEQSFLDWREQTYPRWAEPAHIAKSFALNTNVVHYQALIVLAEWASILGKSEDTASWKTLADEVKKGINRHLYSRDRGYYAAYILDGPWPWKYEGWETLGSSLAVLFGIDEPVKEILFPAVKPGPYGMSVVSPQLKNIRPYHNDGIWPFVSAYYGWALAEKGLLNDANHEFAKMVRSAAMFASFKENMVAASGREKGTAVNSDRQLWSVAGYLAWVYRVIAGFRFDRKGLSFKPVLLPGLTDGITIKEFAWGDSMLDIRVTGTGSRMVSFTFDGKSVDTDYRVPRTLVGRHSISIIMESNRENEMTSDGELFEAASYTKTVPRTASEGRDSRYKVYVETTKKDRFLVLRGNREYKKSGPAGATFKSGTHAWLCRFLYLEESLPQLPGRGIWIENSSSSWFMEAEKADFISGSINTATKPTRAVLTRDLSKTRPNGKGFIRKWGEKEGDYIEFLINIKREGRYMISLRYANGLGPVNTGERCVIREIELNGEYMGSMLFPQRGSFVEWGFSTPLLVDLDKGEHRLKIYVGDQSYNQKNRIEYINIDLLRVRLLEKEQQP